MDGQHLRLEDLPSEFPIFPLSGALLLPRGKLPLNIFEPRYLAMVEDALASGRVIGMIQPDATRPHTPTGPALYRVGCLGRLSSFSETDDGRFLITLTGVVRFRVAEETPLRRGYRRVLGDTTAFRDDLYPAPDADGFDREGVLDALREYFTARGFDANWDAIDEMPAHTLIVTLAMVCPFAPAEKQALLEAPTLPEQAAALRALLQMGSHAPEDGEPGRPVS